MAESTSVYLHIPFCRHRCSYCDFNTYAGKEKVIPDYVAALCREIQMVADAGRTVPVHTIFLGGGTPSLLSVAQLESILDTLGACFEIQAGAEITLEANPGTVSPAYLQGLRLIGVNRLSFGMQSAHPADLRLLERQHDFAEVIQAVQWARQAGFENLSLDLIFGAPAQTLTRWQQSLELALQLAPEHLSLYALTLEPGTRLQRWVQHGLVLSPDDDLAAEMYEWAGQRLAAAGYSQYEISNWAKGEGERPAFACRHNLQYWHNQPYFGFGAGAHGYIQSRRTANVLGIGRYIERCQVGKMRGFPTRPAAAHSIRVDRWTEMQETMMVGLRLTQEGVSRSVFYRRFGLPLGDVFGETIDRLEQAGLLEWAGAERDILRLTRRGRLLGNQVFMHFVNEVEPAIVAKPQAQ